MSDDLEFLRARASEITSGKRLSFLRFIRDLEMLSAVVARLADYSHLDPTMPAGLRRAVLRVKHDVAPIMGDIHRARRTVETKKWKREREAVERIKRDAHHKSLITR